PRDLLLSGEGLAHGVLLVVAAAAELKRSLHCHRWHDWVVAGRGETQIGIFNRRIGADDSIGPVISRAGLIHKVRCYRVGVLQSGVGVAEERINSRSGNISRCETLYLWRLGPEEALGKLLLVGNDVVGIHHVLVLAVR